MSSYALQQTDDTIRARYELARALENAPGREERLAADTAQYYHERRLKAVRRYLRERAARNA